MRPRRKLVNQINVVPFIDVMLVLLIVFMVAAPLIRTGEIELPTVGTALTTPQAPLEVIVKTDKTLALKEPGSAAAITGLNKAQLLERILAAQRRTPNTPVVIAADRQVRYEEVVAILSLLAENNVAKVGLLAEERR